MVASTRETISAKICVGMCGIHVWLLGSHFYLTHTGTMHPAKEIYSTVLKQLFPPVRFAFAYGSAVFQQYGREKVD